MAIDFSTQRWQATRWNYEQWWAGSLARPLLNFTLKGCAADRPEQKLPDHWLTAKYDLTIAAEAIVDRWDYNLGTQRFLGDAFPCVFPNFGPGVAAAFLGARLDCGEDTVWFHAPEDREVGDLKFAFDPGNPWFRRIRELGRAAAERWGDMVQLQTTDLGGNLDLLATFRPAEKLLFDLYDHPEAVKARTWELHDAWWKYHDALSAMRAAGTGYSAWANLYSREPYYMLQCDFSYMIGPEMFEEFVKPELAATCRRLTNPFYHLDGPGQLAHLDSLLSIPELKGIQWIPGAGAPKLEHWPEVFRKIRDAGKLIQVWSCEAESDIGIIDVMSEQLGSAEGIIVIGTIRPDQEREATALLEKYGACPA
jgi:5-methyltetrahydrofolate--homocysteine methyltransferase